MEKRRIVVSLVINGVPAWQTEIPIEKEFARRMSSDELMSIAEAAKERVEGFGRAGKAVETVGKTPTNPEWSQSKKKK